MRTLIISVILLLCITNVQAQSCNVAANVAVYSNYGGGIITINCDQNIPNLKIGVCSYASCEIHITGPFAGNVTAVHYAGGNFDGNCYLDITTTTVSGVAAGIVTLLNEPPVTLTDVNGSANMICSYQCSSDNQGGCNTSAQVADYFETVLGGDLFIYRTQYDCWIDRTYNLSEGPQCCIIGDAPQANFGLSDNAICSGGSISVYGIPSGDIDGYIWHFPGSNSPMSTLPNPGPLVYDTPGVYPVVFTVYNYYGSHTYSQLIEVTNCTVPACNDNGNIVVYGNYNGGILNIICDENIPDLKIGIVSYEAVEVNITGAYASNVTEVKYAGYNSNNDNCGLGILSTVVNGVSPAIVSIEFLPSATLADPVGSPWIICSPGCQPDADGCSSPNQIAAYFESLFGGTLRFEYLISDCWLNQTIAISEGSPCCGALPPADVLPGENPGNALPVILSGNAYPGCSPYIKDYSAYSHSPQNTYSPVSADVWYSFTATSNAVQVILSSVSMDNVILLYNSTATFILDTEDLTGTGEDEVMNYSGLIPGENYLICVTNNGTAAGLAELCVKHIMESTCADGPGTYYICTNFKPTYTGANQYNFQFTPLSYVGDDCIGSYQSQIPLSWLYPYLQHNENYDVLINGTFLLYDGLGNLEITQAFGTQVCPVSIGPQPNVQVKPIQRCSNGTTMLKTSLIQGKPFACGAALYNVEATEVNGCNGSAIGSPFTGTTIGASPIIGLASINNGGTIQGGGRWYSIRWQPVFNYGSGDWCTPQVIYIGGAALPEIQYQSRADQTTETLNNTILLYPNPARSGQVYLDLPSFTQGSLRMYDMNGKLMQDIQLIGEQTSEQTVVIPFTAPSGLYHILLQMDNKVHALRLVVE
jgi:hypothetical protein